MKVLFAVMFCGMLLFAGGCAQSQAPAKVACFEPMDLDANHDGTVTKEEAFAFYAEEFKWFDQDGDGKLSLDDFVSTPEVKAVIDTNKDGVVTLEEYLNYYGNNPCLCGKYM